MPDITITEGLIFSESGLLDIGDRSVSITEGLNFSESPILSIGAISVSITESIKFEEIGSAGPWGAVERDPDLDLLFDCYGVDRLGNFDQGVISVATSILGVWREKVFTVVPILITTSILGSITIVEPILIVASPIVVTTEFKATTFDGFVPFASVSKINWVKWSNIGSLDFTIGKDNVAGERPLDWKGCVYALKKLENKVIAYGENGVSYLIPIDKYYKLLTIHKLGIKGKNAVAGDESTHYFIDNAGQLWKLGETLQLLDYSEFFDGLNNPVLSWDTKNSLLYICDGVSGYVYSPKSSSLGEGPINITGISSQGGALYVASSSEIVIPTFEKWTDIYDMGTRRGKSIISLEFGVDLTQTLQASIKYRLNKADTFSQTGWYNVDSRGVVFIQAYGQEFSFGSKVDAWESFKIDSFRVNGTIHLS